MSEKTCDYCGKFSSSQFCSRVCEAAHDAAREKAIHDKIAKALRLHQVGGDHYAKYAIQPWDIIDCYGLNYYEGTALKYLLRYRDKNGVEDLKKAQHFIDVLITKYGSKDD